MILPANRVPDLSLIRLADGKEGRLSVAPPSDKHPTGRLSLLDPETGRIAFPVGQLPKKGVAVYYRYAFSADLGGGEYDRPLLQPAEATTYRVAKSREAIE